MTWIDDLPLITPYGTSQPINPPVVYPHCYTCPNPDSYDKTPWWTNDDLNNPDFMRGSYWSVVVPGLPFVRGGSSEHPERLLTGLDYLYDRETWWPQMVSQTLAGGFTSWLRWYGNAHVDGGNSIEQFTGDCKLLQQLGIPQVKVALWCKGYDPANMSTDQLKSYFTPILDNLLTNNAVQEIWPGMEWNANNLAGQTTTDYFSWLGNQCHVHGVKMGMHFYSQYPAWQAPGTDWRSFYDIIGDNVDYLNYQAVPVQFNIPPGSNQWDIGEFQARMVDIMNFFGQRGNQWKIRAAEFSADTSFTQDHPNFDEHNSIGYLAACTKCSYPNTHVWGAGDGI